MNVISTSSYTDSTSRRHIKMFEHVNHTQIVTGFMQQRAYVVCCLLLILRELVNL